MPTDWATLGARILAAARQAAAIHMAQATKLHRQAGWPMDSRLVHEITTDPDSAEPNE